MPRRCCCKRAGLPMEPRCVLAPLVAGAVRRGLRLVLRAPVRRLSRDADARLRADRLVDRLPVGRGHRRQQRPGRHLARRPGSPTRRVYYYLTLALCGAGIALLWRVLFSPFGYALRAGRDSPLRAEAIGIDVRALQWAAFVLAGAFGGPGRRALRLLQGQHLARRRSRIAPVGRRAGDGAARRRADARRAGRRRGRSSPGCRTRWRAQTDYWRAVLGAVILLLVLLFPQGLVGGLQGARRALARPRMSDAVLQVDGLHKAFGGVQAVDGRLLRRRRRRAAGADRPERRRQDAPASTCSTASSRPTRGIVRLDGRDIVGLQPRARSGGSASAAPSRSPRPSPR